MPRLELGDCLSRMEGLDDGILDLVVTSPPYGNLRRYPP